MQTKKTGNTRQRIVSGMRPTGLLHIGHYHGVLKNWLQLQSRYDCFFFVADWHALTTHYADSTLIAAHTENMVIDWLSVGLDPADATIFVQSQIPHHAELSVLLSMITPLGWLERVPSYKDQKQQIEGRDLHTFGFLGYPVLQCADIVMYGADIVPVGEDQVAHIELAREIVRRFHHIFCAQHDAPVLQEPRALLSETPKIAGTDGRKMSKSYHNIIGLRDDPKTAAEAIRTMPTDPARVRRNDPGTPEQCPVFDLHHIYSDADRQAWVRTGCTTAGIGCVECKRPIIEAVTVELETFAETRNTVSRNPDYVRDVITEGNKRAAVVAERTMDTVRRTVGLYDPKKQ